MITPWAIDAFLRGRLVAGDAGSPRSPATRTSAASSRALSASSAAFPGRRFAALLRVGPRRDAPHRAVLDPLPARPAVVRRAEGRLRVDDRPSAARVLARGARRRCARATDVPRRLGSRVAPRGCCRTRAASCSRERSWAPRSAGRHRGLVGARARRPRWRRRDGGAGAARATLFPLGPPGAGRGGAVAGRALPRMLDWDELHRMRAKRAAARRRPRAHRAGLRRLRRAGSRSGAGSRPSAATGSRCSRSRIPRWRFRRATSKVYVLALPPDDETVERLAARGWLEVHGGRRVDDRADAAVPTCARRRACQPSRRRSRATRSGSASTREHNAMGDICRSRASTCEVARRRVVRAECRTRVARIQLALPRDPSRACRRPDPEHAKECCAGGRALGWMGAIVADEATSTSARPRRTSRCAPTCGTPARLAATGDVPETELGATPRPLPRRGARRAVAGAAPGAAGRVRPRTGARRRIERGRRGF